MDEAAAAVSPAESRPAFEDSRRLTGPNRWFPGTAVTLTPLGPAAMDTSAHARWAALVRDAAARLGWPDPQPRAHTSGPGATLVLAAPPDVLFTATELNEWAWETAAPDPDFDRVQDIGADAASAARVLAVRAASEWRADLAALRQAWCTHTAAAAAGAGHPSPPPWLLDDEALSIGAGAGCRTWPLATLPLPAAVPWGHLHGVPTALVTGSNGKTTTVRLLAAIARASGLRPGLCSTEGVLVDGHTVLQGDYAGPAGARAVLRHPQVQAAILETARGGILRRGLAVQRSDVAVITRVAPDHLGEYGVHSAQDLAETKLAVAHAVQQGGTLVLNADCPVLMAAAGAVPVSPRPAPEEPGRASAGVAREAAAADSADPAARGARLALFARDHGHPTLAALRAAGGSTCALRAGRLLLAHGGALHDLGAAGGLPLALGGAAAYNLDNACAAALAAACLGWPPEAIRSALQHFGTDPLDNPGRLERWSWRGATVLIDYAHNPDGLAQLLAVARALQPRRLGLLLGQAGNRSDEAIEELARTAAAARPDRVVLKELPAMLRGRAPGEVPALLARGLVAAGLGAAGVVTGSPAPAGSAPGVPVDQASTVPWPELEAAKQLLAWAQPGDVLALPLHEAPTRDAVRALLQQAQYSVC